jgi:hypothetical protein
LNVIAENNTGNLSGLTPYPGGISDALLTATLSTIPEPALAAAMFGLGALMLAIRRR